MKTRTSAPAPKANRQRAYSFGQLQDQRPDALNLRQRAQSISHSPQALQMQAQRSRIHGSQLMQAQQHRIYQLFGGVLQRVEDDDLPALQEPQQEQMQEQIQVHAPVLDISRTVATMSQQAIDACAELALLKEDTTHAEKPDDLLALEARRMALQRKISDIDSQFRALAPQVANGSVHNQLEQEFAAIPQMVHDFCLESQTVLSILMDDGLILAQYSVTASKRDKLAKLAKRSTPEEMKEVQARPQEKSPRVSANQIKEINNWVGGGWSMINRNLLGLLSQEDKDLNAYIRQHGTPDNAWLADVDARATELNAALDNVPATVGVSYRQANYASLDVYQSKIKEGDYIYSKGFFATSMAKGSEGGGGGDTWGRGDKAYFEVTGVTGRSLKPYQTRLGGEHEVLFKSGTAFRVTGISINGTNVFVLLHEVLILPDDVVLKDPFTGNAVTP